MEFLRPRQRARLIGAAESIPAELDAGFELLGNLDRDWIWVLEDDGKVKGVMVASPCHGCAFIWRLAVMPELGHVAVIRLLRRFAADIRARKLKGYITVIDPSTPTQAHLVRILEKLGAVNVKTMQLFASGLPKEGL
jgi:hypothetical protein